jgi:hypothetical protein
VPIAAMANAVVMVLDTGMASTLINDWLGNKLRLAHA